MILQKTRWKQNAIRAKLALGGDRTVEWDGCKWYMDKANGDPEGGLLWDEPAALEKIKGSFIKGNTFVDIGANVGGYSIRADKKGMKVYAFEPNPKNLEFLNANCRLNSSNITVRPVALGARDSIVKITDNFAESKITEGEGILVYQETLDSQKIDRIDLLKIDVEGQELEVLRGGMQSLRRRTPMMMIEVHDTLKSRDYYEIFATLGDLGYKLSRFSNTPGRGLFSRKYIWCEPR
jgi:FkbM family methyltransferase